MFVLTDKGRSVWKKERSLHEAEIERLRKEYKDPQYLEGWCVIDNDRFIKTIEDEVNLLVYGYEEDVLYTLAVWAEEDDGILITLEGKGYTAKDLIAEISKRGLLKWEDKKK